MNKIGADVQELVGSIDYDREALSAKYAHERDVRLRPDANKQYIEVTAEFSHYADDPYVKIKPRDPLFDHKEVLVVGGGMGGILAAWALMDVGVTDIQIIEKGGGLGGTWYWNRYPGVRCDTESYVYLPLIEQGEKIPSEKYAAGSEIRAHLMAVSDRLGLTDRALLQTGVTKLEWNEADNHWVVLTDRGDRMTARFVVLSNGLLVKPKLPGIPGINDFAGHTFHTSRWDYSYTGGDESGGLVNLADKSVGIVGTGATSVQVIPHLGRYARELYVFQRTPAAVDYRRNQPTSPEWAQSLGRGWQDKRIENFNRMMAGLPEERDLVRDGFTATGRLRGTEWASAKLGRKLSQEEQDFITEVLDDRLMNDLRERVDREVDDSATAESLKAWHRRWCKRPLFSDDYLITFNKPNVRLVDTEGKGIEKVTRTGAVFAGREYKVDCLIFATGFEANTEYTKRAGYEVVGRNGIELSDYWKSGLRTFHGIFVRGFPNCFIMGSGQGASAVAYSFPLREQAKHIAHAMKATLERSATRVEPTSVAVESYVAEVRPMSVSQRSFWVDCTPSYMNGEGERDNPHGFYANAHPAGTVEFYRMLAAWRDEGFCKGLEFQ